MTLTEEQRAAIHAVSGLLTAIGCPQCHSYLQKNYTHHIEVLRAMTDSSEHFSDASKMIGFDLENARAADEVLPYPLDAKEIWVSGKGQMHINPPNAPSIFFTLSDLCEFRNIFHGQAAEIERMRAEISEQKGMIWKTQQVKKEQYAQIKELKADLEQSERVIEARLDVIDQQAAKIRELEDVHKRSGVKYAKIINELRSSVYANIPGLKKQWDEILNTPANDKIGPSEEQIRAKMAELPSTPGPYRPAIGEEAIRQLDVKPRSWQITEERKAAIKELSELLTAIGCPSCHYYIQKNYGEDITVLRAMLTEAGQE